MSPERSGVQAHRRRRRVTVAARGLDAAMSDFLLSLLGERLVNSEKAELDVQSLGAKLSLVGLFFGCSLNAPCKQFNGSLCEFYSRFKKTSEHKDKLEIVFISSDQDQKHWQDFLQEMPWPALPFKDRHKKVRWAVAARREISAEPVQRVETKKLRRPRLPLPPRTAPHRTARHRTGGCAFIEVVISFSAAAFCFGDRSHLDVHHLDLFESKARTVIFVVHVLMTQKLLVKTAV